VTHDAAPTTGPEQRTRQRREPLACSHLAYRAAAGLAVAGVLTQISFPLTSGTPSRVVTVLSVLLLACAALVHSGAVTATVRAPAAVLVAAGGTGWAAEAIGVHTGFPFGEYRYSELLGPQLLDVPLLVPLAWIMLGYPCLLLGRRLATGSGTARRVRTALLGGLALASWDLFLDPQLVALGGWIWRFPEPALPGIPGIPLTNYAGWMLVSIVLVTVLDAALRLASPEPGEQLSPAQQATPAIILAWTWLGSAVGNLVFFGRPAVALYGGIAMGALVWPYLNRLRRDQNRDQNRGQSQDQLHQSAPSQAQGSG
jgi:putative membrane protein